jgi:hypothetical protein
MWTLASKAFPLFAVTLLCVGVVATTFEKAWTSSSPSKFVVCGVTHGNTFVSCVLIDQFHVLREVTCDQFDDIPLWEVKWGGADVGQTQVGPNCEMSLDFWTGDVAPSKVIFRRFHGSDGGFGSFQCRVPGFGFIVSKGERAIPKGSQMPLYYYGGARVVEIHMAGWAITTLGTVMLLPWGIRIIKRKRALRHNICTECGYDLRASTNRCPECGVPIEQVKEQSHPDQGGQ